MQATTDDKQVSRIPTQRRLFFAWWPSVEAQSGLHQLAQERVPDHNARLTRRDKIHLTLAFLGPVDEAFAECARKAAASIPWQPFSLVFDRLGWFPQARVMWAGCSGASPQLADLVSQLNEGLVECGFQPDSRRYHAHLTLARKVSRSPDAIEIPARECRFDRFTLVESVLEPDGAHYEVLDTFDPPAR